MAPSAAESDPARKVTFTKECPVTRRQHSFTMHEYALLSSKTVEELAMDILSSKPVAAAIERSRALMEVVYNLTRWERGLENHPLLPEVGWYEEAKGKNLVPQVEED